MTPAEAWKNLSEADRLIELVAAMRGETQIQGVIGLVLSELSKAVKHHPRWPKDNIHRAAIVTEEAGELIQTAIDYELNIDIQNDEIEGAQRARMIEEATHTAAMGVRFLLEILGDWKNEAKA